MANVYLQIDDPANQMTLKVMLEADSHRIVESESLADCAVADNASDAVTLAQDRPALVLATANDIADAVQAMRRGVFGYIFLPFQPGEAPLMVRRALENQTTTEHEEETSEEFLPLETVELRHIAQTLRRCRNNQVRAARVLGIGRNTLWRKLKKIRAQEEGETAEAEEPEM